MRVKVRVRAQGSGSGFEQHLSGHQAVGGRARGRRARRAAALVIEQARRLLGGLACTQGGEGGGALVLARVLEVPRVVLEEVVLVSVVKRSE